MNLYPECIGPYGRTLTGCPVYNTIQYRIYILHIVILIKVSSNEETSFLSIQIPLHPEWHINRSLFLELFFQIWKNTYPRNPKRHAGYFEENPSSVPEFRDPDISREYSSTIIIIFPIHAPIFHSETIGSESGIRN